MHPFGVPETECPICELSNDQKTMPCCRQRVCRACWDAWHASHATCMFCRSTVVEVVVAEPPAEAPRGHACAPCGHCIHACIGSGFCVLIAFIVVMFVLISRR